MKHSDRPVFPHSPEEAFEAIPICGPIFRRTGNARQDAEWEELDNFYREMAGENPLPKRTATSE